MLAANKEALFSNAELQQGVEDRNSRLRARAKTTMCSFRQIVTRWLRIDHEARIFLGIRQLKVEETKKILYRVK